MRSQNNLVASWFNEEQRPTVAAQSSSVVETGLEQRNNGEGGGFANLVFWRAGAGAMLHGEGRGCKKG